MNSPPQPNSPPCAGLRIDVCTFHGLRYGVLPLLRLLERAGARATFFVALGPDRSGRALPRLLTSRPFRRKMVRTRAASMYGWRTALYGTLLPAPIAGRRCAPLVRQIVAAGHELGIHSWDHRTWQDSLDRRSEAWVRRDYRRAIAMYSDIVGHPPPATAAPAWRTNAASLLVASEFGFCFGSDTRGRFPFLPRVRGRQLAMPQVPTTLPTLDEMLGETHRTAAAYVDDMLEAITTAVTPQVHTAHAEAEGRGYIDAYATLLQELGRRGCRSMPLGDLLNACGPLQSSDVGRSSVVGRASPVCVQRADER